MKRNKFNLSHQINTTLQLGQLTPVGCLEVLPGDVFNHKISGFFRVAPTELPIMHPTHIEFFTFFVPNRLIWDSFERFITGDDVAWPHINFDGVTAGSLADYLGLPGIGTWAQSGVSCNALPFRAYNLIYNEYFRDEQLGAPATISNAAGSDSSTDTDLLIAAWRKDRFTSARPSPQIGDAVNIPLDIDGSLFTVTNTVTDPEVNPDGVFSISNQTGSIGQRNMVLQNEANGLGYSGGNLGGSTNAHYFGGLSTSGTAVESSISGEAAAAITVEQLRNSLAVQRFFERMNRSGQRYTEYLRSLGVRSSDARLDRPEYLSHGKQTLQFDEVLQTTPATDTTLPGVGNYKGHGMGAMRSNRYVRHFNEHGILMTLAAVRPTTMYVQGAARMWFRDSYTEYFQPEFQHLGMQPVYVGEIDMKNASDHRTIFGYQDAYDEYRHQPSYVSGSMSQTYYKGFHFGREFASEPSLDQGFTQCVPRADPFQIADEPEVFGMVRHSLRARRLLRRSGKPLTL